MCIRDSSSDVKKGAVSKALIVRTKKEIRRADGDVYKRQLQVLQVVHKDVPNTAQNVRNRVKQLLLRRNNLVA